MPLRFDWPQWWYLIYICRSCAPKNPNHIRKCSKLTLYGTFSHSSLSYLALLLWGCWGCWHKSSRLCLPRENPNPECCWGDPSNSTSSCSNSLGPWPKPNKPIPDDTIFSGKVRLGDLSATFKSLTKSAKYFPKTKLWHWGISVFPWTFNISLFGSTFSKETWKMSTLRSCGPCTCSPRRSTKHRMLPHRQRLQRSQALIR